MNRGPQKPKSWRPLSNKKFWKPLHQFLTLAAPHVHSESSRIKLKSLSITHNSPIVLARKSKYYYNFRHIAGCRLAYTAEHKNLEGPCVFFTLIRITYGCKSRISTETLSLQRIKILPENPIASILNEFANLSFAIIPFARIPLIRVLKNTLHLSKTLSYTKPWNYGKGDALFLGNSKKKF